MHAHETGAKDDVGMAFLNGADNLRQESRVVLIIGVDHDNDIGAGLEGLAVARLLIGAITVVTVMNEYFQSQFAGNTQRTIGTTVIDKDHQIYDFTRKVGIG